MKSLKIIFAILSGLAVLFILLIASILTIVAISLNNTANKDYYIMGNDEIISIKNVVGKRKINSTSTNINNGNTTKKYQYVKIDNVQSDLNEYITEIQKRNFVNTTAYDLSKESDTIKFACESLEKDKIIIMTITYTNNSYTIELQKGKGTLNLYR